MGIKFAPVCDGTRFRYVFYGARRSGPELGVGSASARAELASLMEFVAWWPLRSLFSAVGVGRPTGPQETRALLAGSPHA